MLARLALVALLLLACGPAPTPARPAPRPSATPTPTASPAADACHTAAAVLCALNPAVTQATIGQTICRSGWTATVRPPSSYTDALKARQLQQWDLAGPPSAWEEDHRMPLELGGAPRDEMNLSPEQPASPNPKDHDEDAAKRLVCSGRIGLVTAQVQFAARWLGPYPTYKQ